MVLALGSILYFALFGTIRSARNPATLATWTFWWALLPLSLVLVGRFWCAICPLGAIGAWVQHVADRLGFGPKRKPGAMMRRFGPWLMVVSFITLTWIDRVFNIVRSPRATAALLLVLLAGAVVAGLLYRRRVWCRYLCPLGALSGLYAMTAALELRASNDRCLTCRAKPCYTGTSQSGGCPLYEFPRIMDSNRNCNFCGECVKSCPQDALHLSFRPPGRELWQLRRPLLAEAILGVIMVALVYLQTIDMTLPWGDYMKLVIENTPFHDYNVAFSLTFAGVIGLAVVAYLVMSWGSGRLSGMGLASSLAVFGYAYVPLALAGHLGHNLSHLLLEGPWAAQVILSQVGLISLPSTVTETVPDFTPVVFLSWGVLLVGVAGAFYVLYRLGRRYGSTPWAFWPQFVLLAAFSLAYMVMFLLPMNPRHGH